MAKKPTPAKPTGRALTNWKEELAASAKAQVASEETAASGGGRFFSTRAGQLSFDDAPLPGNQMAVIVLDSMMENVYYEGAFDADQKTPPTCFAFGRDAADMTIHEEVYKHEDTFTPQETDNNPGRCAECWANEWGSASQGKGKACSNRRRLALIPAGTYKPIGKGGGFELDLFDEAQPFRDAELAYLKIPVMSVKGFGTYLKSIFDQFERPLWAVATRIWIEPDPKSQFRVKFELLEVIEDEDILQVLVDRHKAAESEIDFPYLPRSDDDEPARGPQRKAGGAQKLSRKGGAAAKGSSARRR